MSSFFDFFDLLGWMAYPLLATSVVAFSLLGERLWFFGNLRLQGEAVRAAWRRGGLEGLAGKHSPLALLASVHEQNREAPWAVRAELAEARVRIWLGRQRAPLNTLRLIAQIAPLMGLTGTVLGLVKVFRVIQASERMVDPAVLAGGIWEALLTTVVGMFICIPALVGLRVLDRQMERTLEELRSLHAWLRQESLEVSVKSAPEKTTGEAA